MKTQRLRCDFMENPIGFDFERPLLIWQTQAEGTNKLQSAFQVQICAAGDFAAPVCDTDKRLDDSSEYRVELALKPRTRYHWRVRIWDEADAVSEWSEPAFFETGRYGEAWNAEWIGWDQEFPQLRRGFEIASPIRSARVYACGVGLYRLFVNGQPASGERLTPGFNAYDQWLQYQTYDITALLQEGSNAIGAWLGNGYYKGRVNWPTIPHREHIYGDRLGFIAEIILEYADGSKERFGTDEQWRVTKSPYLRAEIYDGEVFDARMFDEDWCTGACDDSDWAFAMSVPMDKGLLHARKSVPVVVTETRPVERIIHTPKGETVLDFGQNFSGWIRFIPRGAAGETLLFQFGEGMDKDGNFYRDNMRTALAEIQYICDGKAREYAPSFTFFGFRYVRITGHCEVRAEDYVGEVVHSQIERTGYFECSDARVNKLFSNALWSQRDNFVDVPTDCPQRDERMGWTGDAQVFSATAMMNTDCNAFYRKYLYDLALEQKKVGYVPVVVPFIIEETGFWKFPTTGWGDAATIMPWNLYLYYGDKTALEAQYDSMKQWVDYMRAQDTEGKNLYEGFHIGDWLAQDTKDPDNLFGLTPTSLVATAYYAYSAALLARAAKVLGKLEDARGYEALSERVKEAFRREFVSPSGRVVSETQTAYLLALYMDMLTEAQRPVAIQGLADRLVTDNVRLTTGFLGTPYLCPVLSECGLNEFAYRLLLENRCPSWLYEVEMGATTIWERWNSVREDGSYGPVSMNSLNHYAFGAVVEWLYRYVAGINPTEEKPGFKRARIQPLVNDMLSSAKARIMTRHGELSSSWSLEEGKLTVEVVVPFNTTAEIVLPAAGAAVTENGAPVEGATFVRGSGVWRYEYAPIGDEIAKRVVFPTYPVF